MGYACKGPCRALFCPYAGGGRGPGRTLRVPDTERTAAQRVASQPSWTGRTTGEAPMAFGFPAYHTQRFSLGSTAADLHNAVRRALESLSWSIREDTSAGVVASIGVNLWSFGERVLIAFLPQNCISITSRCAASTQCFDWGKNKANVSKFITEVQKYV